ncbi:MAG: hypothetical protein QNI84_10740 [Henriciella sp.]|nr:hypothetical protein [Henriciella sp.]
MLNESDHKPNQARQSDVAAPAVHLSKQAAITDIYENVATGTGWENQNRISGSMQVSFDRADQEKNCSDHRVHDRIHVEISFFERGVVLKIATTKHIGISPYSAPAVAKLIIATG